MTSDSADKNGPNPRNDPGPLPPPRLAWMGDVPARGWMNCSANAISMPTVAVEFAPDGEVTDQQVEGVRVALRDLGLPGNVGTS